MCVSYCSGSCNMGSRAGLPIELLERKEQRSERVWAKKLPGLRRDVVQRGCCCVMEVCGGRQGLSEGGNADRKRTGI